MMHFVSWDVIPFPIPICFWKVIQNSMVPVTNQIGKWLKFASYEYHSGVTHPRVPGPFQNPRGNPAVPRIPQDSPGFRRCPVGAQWRSWQPGHPLASPGIELIDLLNHRDLLMGKAWEKHRKMVIYMDSSYFGIGFNE